MGTCGQESRHWFQGLLADVLVLEVLCDHGHILRPGFAVTRRRIADSYGLCYLPTADLAFLSLSVPSAL